MVNAFGTANAAEVSTAQTKFPPTQSDIATTYVRASQSAAVYLATNNCPPPLSAIATTFVCASQSAAVYNAHAFE